MSDALTTPEMMQKWQELASDWEQCAKQIVAHMSEEIVAANAAIKDDSETKIAERLMEIRDASNGIWHDIHMIYSQIASGLRPVVEGSTTSRDVLYPKIEDLMSTLEKVDLGKNTIEGSKLSLELAQFYVAMREADKWYAKSKGAAIPVIKSIMDSTDTILKYQQNVSAAISGLMYEFPEIDSGEELTPSPKRREEMQQTVERLYAHRNQYALVCEPA